jgi:aryl-alcohol dehydrogenase-like predicted oxidoreductase
MKYRKYNKHVPFVSEIGLGAWQLGENAGWKEMSEKEAIYLVHQALDLGVNFFDTAPNYGSGTSESRLGKALMSTDRSEMLINTKFGHTVEGGTNFDAQYIRASLEGSLKRLRVDYVDSFILHNPPFDLLDGNQQPHYEILEDLKEEGKIKAYGASLDTYEEIKLLTDTTNSEVIEVFFNILHQDTARAFALAKEKDLGIIVKIPLDSGWLSGKYQADSTFQDIRGRWSRSDIETRAALVEKVKTITDQSTHLAQAALAFCLAYEEVSTVIPGNTTVEQLKNNVQSTELYMAQEVVQQLEQFYQEEVKDLQLPW